MSNYNKKNCVSVNKSANITPADNTDVVGQIPEGSILVNTPVVLAEVEVNTNLVANIEFPYPVLEIKEIKKIVKVIQCRLLLPTNQLFLKGFVRKNIQYASPMLYGGPAPVQGCDYKKETCISSEIRSLTVDIPFECVTSITDYITDPILPATNFREEFDFFRSQNLGKGYPEKDHLLSSDLSQYHQISSQSYNPLPYCELISHNIIEWDEATDREPLYYEGGIGEGVFRHMVEKMFLQFTVKVLQNQQVLVALFNDVDNG